MSTPPRVLNSNDLLSGGPESPGLREKWNRLQARLGQGNLLSVLDQAIVSGTNFVTSVLIARFCTQSELGMYYLGLSLFFFIQGIQENCITTPYMIFSNRRSAKDRQRFAGSIFIHQFGLTAIGLVLVSAFFTSFSLFDWGPQGLQGPGWVLIGILPLMLLREFLRRLSFAHLKVRSVLLLDITVSAVQVGGMVLAVVCHQLTLSLVYAILGFSCLIATLGWFLRWSVPMTIERQRVMDDLKRNWTFSRWLLVGCLLGAVLPYVLPWMLAVMHSEAETGLFAAAMTLIGVSRMFVSGISNNLTPRASHALAESGVGGLQTVLHQTTLLYLMTLLPFALIITFWGEAVATVVLGAKYSHTGPIMGTLAFSILAYSLSSVSSNGLLALECARENFMADLLTAVLTPPLALMLILPWGAMGAALATCGGNTVMMICRRFLLARAMSQHQTHPPPQKIPPSPPSEEILLEQSTVQRIPQSV